jgi:hypothetical protein
VEEESVGRFSQEVHMGKARDPGGAQSSEAQDELLFERISVERPISVIDTGCQLVCATECATACGCFIFGGGHGFAATTGVGGKGVALQDIVDTLGLAESATAEADPDAAAV